jgi:hypothetical protein
VWLKSSSPCSLGRGQRIYYRVTACQICVLPELRSSCFVGKCRSAVRTVLSCVCMSDVHVPGVTFFMFCWEKSIGSQECFVVYLHVRCPCCWSYIIRVLLGGAKARSAVRNVLPCVCMFNARVPGVTFFMFNLHDTSQGPIYRVSPTILSLQTPKFID